MLASALRELLEEQQIPYDTIQHPIAYTAQEIAASAHVPGLKVAKTVMAKLDGKLAMIVVSAAHRVDLEALRQQTGAHRVELAHEDEFQDAFPECELGAMPPFGNLYGMDVFVEKDLARNATIVFSAGAHDELVRMAYQDFASLVRPRMLETRC